MSESLIEARELILDLHFSPHLSVEEKIKKLKEFKDKKKTDGMDKGALSYLQKEINALRKRGRFTFAP